MHTEALRIIPALLFFTISTIEMSLLLHLLNFYQNFFFLFQKAQDPTAFGEEFANKARKALQTRYRLLPFLYTLFYEAQVDGSTVVRPVMHE